jgi:hypothetical protein
VGCWVVHSKLSASKPNKQAGSGGSWVILVPLSCFCEELPNHIYVCMYVWYQNCIDCKPLILSVTGFAKLPKEDLICNTTSISEIVGSD